MKIKRMIKLLFILLMPALAIATGCSERKEFTYNNVEISYDNLKLTALKKPQNISNRDEFTDFLDYVVFNGTINEYIYTTVSDEYKEVLTNNLEYEARWAGQYGALAHNFLIDFDFSNLANNEVGAYGYIFPYATLKNEANEYTNQVLDYNYYNNILSNNNDRNYKLDDFYLYKNNNGYLKVNNSEQLFYAISKGYMPYIEDSELKNLFSSILGILNRILKEGMSDYEKYEAMYLYLTNEVRYDYKMLNNKEGEPRLYRCYYLEGAIIDSLATCDGLTKALTVFSIIEGIPSMHIGAVSYNGGHAYNYSNINDQWYLSCVTNGSHIENYKGMMYLTHTKQYFLSDLIPSPSFDFDSSYRLDIKEKIDTKFNYWSNTKIKVDNLEYSLEIENVDDGITILNYIDRLANKNKISLDIELLMDYDLYKDMEEKFKFKSEYQVVNNGIFKDKKLYNFVFIGD